MKKTLVLIILVVTLLAIPACSSPVSANLIQSSKPRATEPVTSSEDMTALVNGNSKFAFSLYQAIKGTEGNIFYSSYSISQALAMTYAGARSDTEKQMADTLSFNLPQNTLHPAFNSLDLQLKSRGQGAQGKDGKGFRLNIVNAIWGQKDYKFDSGYLDVLAENYGAGLRILDYKSDPEKSRITINQWVSKETEDKIKDLIPQGAIDQLTRLVLTNAIYFNAAWLHPFQEGSTNNGTFNLLNGNTVIVPMMRQTQAFNYEEGNDYQAVELPYDGRELSMIVILPHSGQFNAVEFSLDSRKIDTITANIKSRSVALTMPKFKFESTLGLKKTLTAMGMSSAFSAGIADFSGMNGNKDLYITDVLHKSFVAVDEAGTEAAAASAVIVGTTSVPVVPVEVKIDRPFVFFIRDVNTGAILFVGRVVNPGA